MRLELADDRAATQTTQHEQDESDAAEPLRSLQTGNSRSVLKNIVDAKAENAGLPCNIEKLSGNAERKVFAAEQVPIS